VTAIWARNDLRAAAAITYPQEKGIRLLEHASVIDMDSISLAPMVNQALTTIRHPFREMCKRAVELVIRTEGGPDMEVRKAGSRARFGRA